MKSHHPGAEPGEQPLTFVFGGDDLEELLVADHALGRGSVAGLVVGGRGDLEAILGRFPRTRCIRSGGPAPAGSSPATTTEHGPTHVRCSRARPLRAHSVATSGLQQRHGRPAPPCPSSGVVPRLQTKPVQAREGGQVRVGEGSVEHVEVHQMSGGKTFLIGGAGLLSGHWRAVDPYPDLPHHLGRAQNDQSTEVTASRQRRRGQKSSMARRRGSFPQKG